MIFEDERPGMKINWIKLVNNMISFSHSNEENLKKRADNKHERDNSQTNWEAIQQRIEDENL